MNAEQTAQLQEEREVVLAVMKVLRKRLTEKSTDALLDKIIARLPVKYRKWYWRLPLKVVRGKADDFLPDPALDALEDFLLEQLERQLGGGAT